MGEKWFLTTQDAGGIATLVYRFRSPYPFLAGAVRIVGETAGGRIELDFAEGERPWQALSSADASSGAIDRLVATSGYFRNGYGRPVYDYRLRLTLRSPQGGYTRLGRLVVTSDFQHAPQALPELVEGENSVRYLDDSRGDREVEVVFRFDVTGRTKGGRHPGVRSVHRTDQDQTRPRSDGGSR